MNGCSQVGCLAAISTSSGAKCCDAKNKPPKKGKSALFRLQSDGEVFIVKKAEDSAGKSTTSPRRTYNYMDHVKKHVKAHEAKLEPKLEDGEEQKTGKWG